MFEYYKRADVVLIPSYFEGFGIVAVEAMNASSPVVTTCAGGLGEIIEDNYNVKITLQEEYFETRRYGELIFPAGDYTALKVVLGKGEGHNWWCVMFPPLCVPVATGGIETDDGVSLEEYLDEDGKRIVTSEGKFKVGFKVVEWYEKLFK